MQQLLGKILYLFLRIEQSECNQGIFVKIESRKQVFVEVQKKKWVSTVEMWNKP